MLTITISKSELKKAFFGGCVDYAQEFIADDEAIPIKDLDIILLKIMLENYINREGAA